MALALRGTLVGNFRVLMLCTFLAAPVPAPAQPLEREGENGQRVRVEEVEGVAERQTFTLLPDGTAVSQNRPLPSTKITFESDIPITVSAQLPPTRDCAADIALAYVQANTTARVEGELNNAQCAASSGSYTIAVSIRDANGETQTLEFLEAWQRTDDEAIFFESAYPIGENVDLLRVRTRRISCTCAEVPVAGE